MKFPEISIFRKAICLIAFSWLGASTAAAVLLQYEGTLFTTQAAGTGRVDASFEVPANLITPGAVLGQLDIGSFSVSAAGRTITDATSTFTAISITLGPGPSLLPVSWQFAVESNLEGASQPEAILSASLTSGARELGSGAHEFFAIDDQLGNTSSAIALGAVSHIGSGVAGNGIWSIVPEPSAFVFLGLAAGGLAVASRRRKPA